MYLRFVVESIDRDSQLRQGVVLAAHEMKKDPAVAAEDREALNSALGWLDNHLPSPDRFNRTTSKGYYRRRATGISWFKDTAHAHLAHVRELVGILERNGRHVSTLKESRPGYIVYEDEFQVVAEPFADARK